MILLHRFRPRLLDTLIGALIAGLTVWLVLPDWQSRQLPKLSAQLLLQIRQGHARCG